jgi:O-methyltransferase
MIGRKRLRNIVDCLDVIRCENIAGDWIETGVWRGGAVVLMRGYAEIYQMERTVWAADSFEGLPKPTAAQDKDYDFSADVVPVLAISEEEVRNLFKKYNLYDPEKVVFLKGWFKDTLEDAAIDEIGLLRIDGDLYESTMDSLRALYDRVVPGGFLIVDDYGDFEPCRSAVEEFRSARGIVAPLQKIDWTGVYWRKI